MSEYNDAKSSIAVIKIDHFSQKRFNRDLWDEKDVDTLMTRTQPAAFIVDPSIPPFTPLSTPMSVSSATTSSF